MTRRLIYLMSFLVLSSAPAYAHLNPQEHGSFLAGLSHPLFGADHILAMVAVGLWAALLGGRALWQVPLTFVSIMLVGFATAMAGLPLPFVEPVVLASVVVIGLTVAVALRLPVAGAMAFVGVFAFFHGHAHGSELGAAGFAGFSIGFASATALLHTAGLAFGFVLKRLLGETGGRALTRIAGLATAFGGLYLIIGA